jgi:zinc transport system substrate-binding protein
MTYFFRQIPGPIGVLLALLGGLAWGAGCGRTPVAEAGWVVTIHPLQMIVTKLAVPGAPITQLLAPGASPHTYEPSARDASTAAAARALLYVDDSLDAWAAVLPAPRRIQVGALLPEPLRLGIDDTHDHDHAHEGEHDGHHHHPEGAFNAHFWTDPLAVAAVLPGLAAAMAEADPPNAAHYHAQAAAFGSELESLAAQLAERLRDRSGTAVAQFHPSWDYLFHRHGLRTVGLVEPAPGREASPRYLRDLIARLQAEEVRLIITEPQLPARPAEVVAESTGARMIALDPVGGAWDPDPDYAAWLLRQVDRLLGAL